MAHFNYRPMHGPKQFFYSFVKESLVVGGKKTKYLGFKKSEKAPPRVILDSESVLENYLSARKEKQKKEKVIFKKESLDIQAPGLGLGPGGEAAGGMMGLFGQGPGALKEAKSKRPLIQELDEDELRSFRKEVQPSPKAPPAPSKKPSTSTKPQIIKIAPQKTLPEEKVTGTKVTIIPCVSDDFELETEPNFDFEET